MERDELMWLEEYEKILRGHCRSLKDCAPLDPEAPLVLLGLDSIEIVGLIVDLEEAFECQLPEQMVTPQSFATARALWEALEEHLDLSSNDGSRAV